MDTIVAEDSPLGLYLEGKGEVDLEHTNAPPATSHQSQPFRSFAPSGRPSYTARLRRTTLGLVSTKPVTTLRNAYAYTIASTLGAADNERFLEHFRYILIASQLLNEHVAPGSFREQLEKSSPQVIYDPLSVTFEGVSVTAGIAFALVLLLHWSRRSEYSGFHVGRLFIVGCLVVLVGLVVNGFARRKWLQVLRHQAVTTATELVANAQAFETTSTSILALIQEVELVSRGYRISSPLPPISRIEGDNQPKQCPRLRRNLLSSYQSVVPAYINAAKSLCFSADDDDLERFLEAYDVREEDLVEAFAGCPEVDRPETLTIRQARIIQARLLTLRRLVVCSLLSVPATGRKEDAVQWNVCVKEMKTLSEVLRNISEQSSKLLNDEDNTAKPESPSAHQQSFSAAKSLPYAQARRISALSSGIRSIQARLYLFQDDSNRALSSSHTEEDLATLSTSLKIQYEAIGADLKTLMQAWESGRQALVEDITRQERRMSLTPLSARTPVRSPGGFTHIGGSDDEGSLTMSPRSATFSRLGGDPPLTPPITESEDESAKDDEVFEAVALPRQRSTLTREQRIAKMHEERERQAAMREKREANSNMIRELQAVINLRPQRRATLTGPMTNT